MSYTKSLVPHLYRYVPKYFQKKYPKFMNLMIGFMEFLELKNSLSFFDGSTEKDHSIYQNVVNFGKHAQIENLPIKNKDVLNSYFKEYAQTLDFRNIVLDFDETTFRDLAKYSGMIFNTKAKWSSYNIFFAIISSYLFNGSERGVVFKAYFNEDFSFDTETPPEFYDIVNVSALEISNFAYSTFVKNGTDAYGFVKFIDVDNNKLYVDCYEGNFSNGDDLLSYSGSLLANNITMSSTSSLSREDIILSEYPLYKLNFGFDGVNVTKDNVLGKGCRPFEYQILSKSDIFISGNFISKFKTAFNPAGFRSEIIYVPEDVEGEIYIDSIIFPKQKLSLYTYEDDLNITLPVPGEILYNTEPYNITFNVHNITSVDILIDGVVIESDYNVNEGSNVYSYTPNSPNPLMLITIRDHIAIDIDDSVIVNIVDRLIIINSLNGGNPFYFIGEYTEGVHYFFTNDGRIVPSTDPDITTWYAGLGNADGDIDLDVKQLIINNVASPANVELDVEFNVTGNYVLIGGKITIYATAEGGSPVKVSTGAFVQCAGGTFSIPVTLPSASFGVNTVVTFDCQDYEMFGLNDTDTSNVIATMTMEAITGMVENVDYDFVGTTNGTSAEFWADDGTGYAKAGDATLDGLGNWTYTDNFPAGTYSFKIVDGTNPDGKSEQTGIDVEANQNDGQYMYEGPNTGVNQSKISADYGVNFSNNGAVGTVNSIAVLANGDWAYMACSGGIVVKVTKAGVVSTLLSDGSITFGKIMCSDNGQYAIVKRGLTGVYFTIDFGANWTLLENGNYVPSVFCSGSGSVMAYFVSGGKPTFSIDSGANWTAKGTTNYNWIDGCCCGSYDGSVIYAGANATDTIIKFTNNGDTRTKLTIDGRTWNIISCSSNGDVVVAGANGVAWKVSSADYGATWNTGTGVYGLYMPDASKILVSGDGTKMMYCNAGDGKWYKSVFAPNNYPSAVTPAGQTAVASGDMTTDGKYIIVGTSANIYTSQNFGANWTAISTTNIKSVALNNKRT